MQDVLQGLNANQKIAVTSPSSVLQVLAPPGSGKTKTLTARVAYLVTHRQLLPWNIIVCTFTVKAASEMKERIRNFVGDEVAKQLKLGTFHSVALRYLKHYGQHIGLAKDFGIADSSDSKAILKRIIKKLGMTIEPGSALGRISSRKVKGNTASEGQPKTAEQQDFQRLFDNYESTLAASNLLDYDDILLRCCYLLETYPQCICNVEAVLIDEFQDTNNVQYDLMRLFAQHRNVITIVGDPDQSIYGFRAAEIKNLMRMKFHWPDTLTINLEHNYRSSGAILHAAQNIIEQDANRPPKKLQATHTFGLRPVLRKLPSASAESDWLVSEMKRLGALSGNMIQYSDFAILLRSAVLSRVIETALGNAGIPYRMVGGMRFYDRAEVKLVVDYLRVIHQPDNNEAIERIINVPARKIGDETIKKLRIEAESKDVSIWKLVLQIAQGRCSSNVKLAGQAKKGLESFVGVILAGRKKIESWVSEPPSLVELINTVTQKISLQAYLKSKHTDDETYEARWKNVEELMAQAADVMAPARLHELLEADGLPVIEGLEQRESSSQDVLSVFLANIALTASAEKRSDNGGEKLQQVTISTIHAAKGLEWPVVFIPACYDGSIPHSRADDTEEERRLLYVGMTRAQAVLYLSCPVKNSQRDETTMSAFLTHTGVMRFFEEHGPSLPFAAIKSLSKTLQRECPLDSTVDDAKRTLERDEDNYWPLNGEEAIAESVRWDQQLPPASLSNFGNTRAVSRVQSDYITMQRQTSFSISTTSVRSGFVSVAAQYDELMEQATLRMVDKRADDRHQPRGTLLQGRKRQAEGQGGIASFFSKKQRSKPSSTTAASAVQSRGPLEDLSETVHNRPVSRSTQAFSIATSHKPRSTPISQKPSTHKGDQENTNQYVFLSSSPAKPDVEQAIVDASESCCESSISNMASTTRPANTYHTTSMTMTAPQRRTLGVRRSLHGWNARRPE